MLRPPVIDRPAIHNGTSSPSSAPEPATRQPVPVAPEMAPPASPEPVLPHVAGSPRQDTIPQRYFIHIDHYYRFAYFVPVLRWRAWQRWRAALDVYDSLIDPVPLPRMPAGVIRIAIDDLANIAVADPQVFNNPALTSR